MYFSDVGCLRTLCVYAIAAAAAASCFVIIIIIVVVTRVESGLSWASLTAAEQSRLASIIRIERDSDNAAVCGPSDAAIIVYSDRLSSYAGTGRPAGSARADSVRNMCQQTAE